MKKVKYSKNPVTRSETRKKRIPKEVIWTLFIAIIMVSSIIGFLYSGGGGADYTYNDKFKFTRTDNNLFIYKNPDNNLFTFRYLPYELENLNISANIQPPMVYLTFDPEADDIETVELMRFELLEDFSKLNIFAKQGITKNSTSYTMEVVDCNMATQSIPVIKFTTSNETKIIENNNCINLQGESKIDIIRLKERILYKALDILE